jgi:hypothetical protein
VLLLAPRTFTRTAPDRLSDSIVVRWNEALLDAVEALTLGRPMTARVLAVVHACAYEAWVAYDEHAAGTQLGNQLRRPARERTFENIRQAISFAAYRALVDLLPASTAPIFDPLMSELGYDPRDRSLDTSTPAGIGNTAAAAVLEFRHQDGANQLVMRQAEHPARPTPITRATLPSMTRWTCAGRSIPRRFTIRTLGSLCGTSTAPARSSRLPTSGRSGVT